MEFIPFLSFTYLFLSQFSLAFRNEVDIYRLICAPRQQSKDKGVKTLKSEKEIN